VLDLFETPIEAFKIGKIKPQAGDCPIVATDGVTDAANGLGLERGSEAFVESALRAHRSALLGYQSLCCSFQVAA
jgi:serine phosphatase RsbU (regulator of sigma subunit)